MRTFLHNLIQLIAVVVCVTGIALMAHAYAPTTPPV